MREKPYSESMYEDGAFISLRVVASNTLVLEVAKEKEHTYEPQRLTLSIPTLLAVERLIASYRELSESEEREKTKP